MFWNSTERTPTSLLETVLDGAILVTSVSIALARNFKFFESKAEQLGRRLLVHLSKIPYAREYAINLIGYSLGARAIHYALAIHDWSRYRLQDVILLGGAADANDDDWPACAEKLRGKIYNAWSPIDHTLDY